MPANYPLESELSRDLQGSGPSGFRSVLPPVHRLFRSGALALTCLTLGVGAASAGAAPGNTPSKSVPSALPKATPVAAKPAAARPTGSPPPKVAVAPGVSSEEIIVPALPRRVRLDFVDADVQEVFRALAAQTRANIVVSPEVKGMITASLRGMSVEEALDAVSRMAGVAYRKVDDTYYVAPKARLDEMFAAPAVTQTYSVQNADAAELAAVVRAAIPTLLEAVPAGKSLVVLKGPREAVEKAMAVLPSLDVDTTPEAPALITRIQGVHHIDPITTVSTLTEMFGNAGLRVSVAPLRSFPQLTLTGGAASTGGGASGGGGGGGGGTETNTLPSDRILLTGPAEIVERATEMVNQLDVAPPQFEIQARVLDVNTNKLAQRGIQWNYTNLFSFDEQNATPVTPALRVGTFGRSSLLGFDAIIPPMIQNGDARILAEPSIRVIEGRSARIFIGDTITAVVDRTVTPTGTNITTKEFTPGITLLVSGHSTPDGEITLDVRPTVSFLTSLSVPGIDIPVPQIRERSAQTTIRLRDGETMVLGGLLQDEDIQNMTKVPLLGDLPFFGNLFRSRNITKRRSEVVIFLTTRLLRSQPPQ